MIIIGELSVKNIPARDAAPHQEETPVPACQYPPIRSAAAALIPALVLLAALTACSKDAPPPEDVRPVRAMTLAAGGVHATAEFSGDVRPRYESRLGFRVAGKISARKVDVGSIVKRGTLLMQLDPQDLRLGQAQAQASLRAAQTNADLARAELKRYQDLRSQNFVSQAVLDQKIAASHSSQANVEAARAQLREQANQTGYASLESDTDGVVTGIDAEVGQVVSAGAPVVRVARTDEKEVVIGVPEDQVDELRQAGEVAVRLWADPNRSISGKIRELSPVADPATRTYTVKVSIPPSEEVRLGMTAVVQVVRQTAAARDGQLRAPLSSLVQNKGASSVWVIENGVVRLQKVDVGGVSGNDVLLTGGVKAGQAIVTAGVNLLKNGQKVKILSADVARRGDAEAAASGAGGGAAGGVAQGPAQGAAQ
jgi:RND family efflux transporter MFP subunit